MTTAIEAREFLLEKIRLEDVANEKRWEKANVQADSMIKLITEGYNPKRIWQWGSVLDETQFRDYSDIDIAVEGDFSAEKWFELLGKILDVEDIPVDIVDIDKIDPVFADLIKSKGKVVYEQKTG